MTQTAPSPPRENLTRGMPAGYDLAEGDGQTLVGRIANANEWAEIDSVYEGHFMERFTPGAFTKTFAESRDRLRILFQHGRDPELGMRPIAAPEELGEDTTGPFYRARLLEGLPAMIVDGLRKRQYGSSHTFTVVREDWNPKPRASAHNPKGIPERTVREAKVKEISVVTWPAYAGATAGVRSLTDEVALDTLTADPARLRELVAHVEPDTAPSLEAGAEPHLEPERREEPVAAPTEQKEKTTVEYVTRDEKSSRVTELKAELAKLAVEYPGVLPPDEQVRWDSMCEEQDALERDIRAWDERQARLAAYADDQRKTERAYDPPMIVRRATVEDIYDFSAINREGDPEKRNQLVRDNALRSIDSARVARSADLNPLVEIIDDADEGEEGKGEIGRRVLLTGSPVYKRAWRKYLRGQTALWTPEEARAAALAVTGTTTTGGYAVPYVFDPTMLHIGAHTSVNPYRAACRVETITNGNNWKAVTVGAITAAYGAEALALTEGGPTFGQPDFTVQTARAFVTLSHETLQDRPDAVSELTSIFGEAKDTLEENQFTLGTGATVYPFGMFRTAAFTNQDTATNDTTAITDMALVESALPLRHRANAAYFMSRSTMRQLMALDTTHTYFSGAGINYAGEGNPTNGSPVGNTGIKLLGYPVWEVPSAVSTLTTDGAIIVVFGDPRNYVIVDRLGMSVEVIQNMTDGATPSFPTMQRGVLAYWRNTARPINADGMRSLSVQ